MKTYVAILRGINVSGQKKINMNDLKELLAELNYKNIITYIQSGNVIFEQRNTKPGDLSKQIEQKIFKKYKFEVPVIIRTNSELKNAVDNNPFMKEKGVDTERLYVIFLAEKAKQEYIDKTYEFNYEQDRFIISDKEVYIYCPRGYGKTKLNNNFFENKLKVTATTRNIKTVKELIRLSE